MSRDDSWMKLLIHESESNLFIQRAENNYCRSAIVIVVETGVCSQDMRARSHGSLMCGTLRIMVDA